MDESDLPAADNQREMDYYLRILNHATIDFRLLYALRENDDGLTIDELNELLETNNNLRPHSLNEIEEDELIVSWPDYRQESSGLVRTYNITGIGVAALDAIETFLEAERRALDANPDTTEGRVARALGTSEDFENERISVISSDDDLPDDIEDRSLVLRVEMDETRFSD